MYQAFPSDYRPEHEHIRVYKQYPRGAYPAALGGDQRTVQQRILQTIKTVLVMTQIIFQVVAMGCCIYTAYRLGLFIYKKLRRNNKTAKAVQVTSHETSDRMNPAIEPARSFSSVIEEYADILPKETSEKVSYQITYLITYPLGNRIQVYINRDSYTYIKRFLSVVSPDTSMSGFISRIIDEHLKKHEKEMSALYTECINKPL